MIATARLGFPRIGPRPELRVVLERFWAGEWNESQLEAAARELRRTRWQLQSETGIARPSNDFSLYDHVLDRAVITGSDLFQLHRSPVLGYVDNILGHGTWQPKGAIHGNDHGNGHVASRTP